MTDVFDRVIVREDDGTPPRMMPRDEFVRLPIHARIRFILERRVEFFLGPVRVDRATALQGLRTLTAQRAKTA